MKIETLTEKITEGKYTGVSSTTSGMPACLA